MKRKNGTLPIVLLPLILILGVAAGCGGENPVEAIGHDQPEDGEAHAEGSIELSPEKMKNISLRTAVVEERVLAPELETTGMIDYEQDRVAHVSPRVEGRVQGVAVALGDRVRAGQSLATIDSVELGMAKASYVSAKASEALARENYDREKGLYEERISSQKEMLESRAAYQQASSERQRAEEVLRLLGLSPAVIESLHPGDSTTPLYTAKSPIAGVVVEKHVTLGELVSPDDVLFTVADLGHVWVWIDVYERDLAAVHLGDEVVVVTDAYQDRDFTGEVTYVSASVESETRTVRARIDVANPDGALRPGMFARVRISDPHETDGRPTLAVAAASVVSLGGEDVVFVSKDEGRFEIREVKTGRKLGDWVEILEGLEPGEVVVTEGAFLLKSEASREGMGEGHGH